MNFICYIGEHPATENEILSHLRKCHKIKEGVHKMQCCVNFNVCGKTYTSFSGLKKHHVTCLQNKLKTVIARNKCFYFAARLSLINH